MRARPSPCSLCYVVNKVSTWDWEQATVKSWKRPALFVDSLLILFLCIPLFMNEALSGFKNIGWMVVIVFIVLIGLLRITVAIKGCDSCVARMYLVFSDSSE